MCDSGGSTQPQATGPTLAQRESLLSALNDQQVANIEIQRQQWDAQRLNQANPVITNLLKLQGQDDSLDGLGNQANQIAASAVTGGTGGGGNGYVGQQSGLSAQIAAAQKQLSGINNTPFTFQYTPTTTDKYGSTPDSFYQTEEAKSSALQNDFGSADQGYNNLLTQYNSSIQSLQDQAHQSQSAGLTGGSQQSAGQAVTGNQGPATAASAFTNLDPKMQQAASLGVAPLNQLNSSGTKNNSLTSQGNITGGASSVKGQSNVINNT